MTYTPIQLEVIKRFGRKELTEGCLIQQGEYLMNIWCIYEGIYNMNEINSANCMQVQKSDIGEILGHIPEIFPDVARVAKEKGYSIEVVKGDMFTSLIKISRWDIVKPTIMEFKDTISLLEQPESVLIELLNLFK